jgi:two-component system sensor histidine kinase/response regulator
MENKKNKYLSIKTKVTLSIVLFVLIILAIVLSFSYISARNSARDAIKKELINIVGIAALQINGDDHSLIKNITDDQNYKITDISSEIEDVNDKNSEPYNKIKKILQKIRDNSTDIIYIYTFRENEKKEIYFVVDAEEDLVNMSQLGDVYNDASIFLKKNFSTIDKPIVEPSFTTDKWGTWLSGYAPFYDSLGRKEGVLGVDIGASNILKKEKDILMVYLLTFIISAFFAIILSFILIKKLIGSIMSLSNILKKDNTLNIENISNDEVGELAGVIKNIMEKTNISQKEKDESIIEKTSMLEKINKLMVGRELEMIKLKKEINELKNNKQ